MRLKAIIVVEEKNKGRPLSQSKVKKIANIVRLGARGNNRGPLDNYGEELKKQRDDPNSPFNRLKWAVAGEKLD